MDKHLIIREMTIEDAPKAAQIEAQIFSQPWSEKGFVDSLAGPYTYYLAAELCPAGGDVQKELSSSAKDSGCLAGYCGYLRSFEIADITNVAVAPSCRRRGIARKMLTALMAHGRAEGIERFTLEVRKSNTAAVALYEQLGFRTEGVRRNFYALPTEDALIMWTPEMENT